MTDVLAFCVLLVGLTAFVAAPLYARRVAPVPETTADGHGRSARREAILSALRDLEIDHASGLVDEPGYAVERTSLEAEAARLALPAHRPESPSD